jgi:hypothetical protein
MPLYPPSVGGLVRNLAQKYIQSGLRRGLSANSIQTTLQRAGLGYRRQTLLSDVKYWKEAFEKGDYLKYVNRALRPSTRLYMQTAWQTKARYETVVEFRLKDRFTGETIERRVTVAHTHLEAGVEVADREQNLTRAEIEEAAEEMVGGYGLEDRFDVESIVPVIGWYNPDVS